MAERDRKTEEGESVVDEEVQARSAYEGLQHRNQPRFSDRKWLRGAPVAPQALSRLPMTPIFSSSRPWTVANCSLLLPPARPTTI